MSYFQRDIQKKLVQTAESFPVTVLTGPRQSGKTTLLKHLFPEREYINLEEPDTFEIISGDIRGFLKQDKKWIIDEAQRLPKLFSFIQAHLDEQPQAGKFILSGSQNFLLSEKISQSLAGRAAILELLPLSYHEYLSHPKEANISIWEFLFHGGYPRPYQEELDLKLWFNSYIQTYLERDVRSLKNIHDLPSFQRFLRLCAGRHGQLLNLTSLANDAGISQSTASEWINILETSYIVYRLQPYYKNFNKRIIKTPKLYFYDSAIVCRLLGIDSIDHLQIHSARGAIFEGYILSEYIKKYYAQGEQAPIYFWRDVSGIEVDLVLTEGEAHQVVEIKSGATYSSHYLKNLLAWKKFSDSPTDSFKVIYTGDRAFSIHGIQIISWNQLN